MTSKIQGFPNAYATRLIHFFFYVLHTEFRPGTCYPLTVPENHEATIIHKIVATDLDDGLNSDIIYTITGNFIFFNKKSVVLYTIDKTISIKIVSDTID